MQLVRGLFSTRRRVAVAAAVVVVAAAATWWFTRADAEASPTTVTATVTSSTVSDTVTGSGTLEAAKSKELSFSSSGTVTSVDVSEGQAVSKGDVLARIDTTTLKASLASARAQLDSAESTAADDGSESSAQRSANDASVESARAAVSTAEDALSAATLKAPFSGLVSSVGLEVGDAVGGSSGGTGGSGSTGATTPTTGSSSSTSSTTTGSITVITPKRFTVTADVTADDVAKVKKAMQAEVTPTGATDPVYGTVTEVGKVASVGTSGSATFPVTVTLTGENDDLYAGTSADVSIIVEKRENVLSVPTQAVTTTGGSTYVDKVVDGKTTKTKITIGDTFGPTTEVKSGLSSGDKVSYTQAIRIPGSGSRSGQEGGFPGGGEGFPSGGFPGGGAGGGFPGGGQ